MYIRHIISMLIFFFLYDPFPLYAQRPDYGDLLHLLDEDGESGNYNTENLLEDFYDNLQSPVNINISTREQLEIFPFLDDAQIEHILAYIYMHGAMKTIHELQLVEGMDKQTIRLLTPFACVAPVPHTINPPSLKQIITHGKNEVLTRVDFPFYTRKGYEHSYLGTKYYHSLRYSFRYKDQIYTGITAEKDAGEPMFSLHNQKGYDYYSPYLYLKNVGCLKALALGNYRLSFGQGLVINQDFILGKGTSLSIVNNRAGGIKRHASTGEYNYLQGIAAAVQRNAFTFSAFYSRRSLDASIKDGVITAIQKSGLHRTKAEAERRGAAVMQLMGGNVEYAKKRLRMGLTAIYYLFNHPYAPTLRAYSRHNLRGNDFCNAGINYTFGWRRFSFRGEVATDKQGRFAVVNALHYSARQRYELMLLHRYYDYRYWNWFARSFSESGYVQNENGWYVAVEARPFKDVTFFLSADLFSFPWWRYMVDAPSGGCDLQAGIRFKPSAKLDMYVRYRYKQTEKNYTENKQKSVRALYRHRFRYQLGYSPTGNLLFRTIVGWNSINPAHVKPERGYLLSEAVSCKIPGFPLQMELQGSYFHTASYASRIYVPEKGLLNTLYTPSFHGRGYRLSAFLRYDPGAHLMVIVKYGQTTYSDRSTIGTGNDLIDGDSKCDLQMQVRWKF